MTPSERLAALLIAENALDSAMAKTPAPTTTDDDQDEEATR